MGDMIDNAPAKRKGRPRKTDGERKADLPDAVRKFNQVQREESGTFYGDTGENSADDNKKYMESVYTLWGLSKIDLDDADQVEERISWYFGHCSEKAIKPSVAGLALALGVDRRRLYEWDKGISRNGSRQQDLIKRARDAIICATEFYAQDGKMNPAIAIFLLKNHGGYTDVQQLTVEAKQQEFEERKLSDVLEEYDDIPEAE